MHVDEFIDFGIHRLDSSEEYARWVMNHFRLSANLKYTFNRFMKDHKLFCTYEEKTYRVVGASRLGDVWLSLDFKKDKTYQKRVDVTKCTNWSPTCD